MQFRTHRPSPSNAVDRVSILVARLFHDEEGDIQIEQPDGQGITIEEVASNLARVTYPEPFSQLAVPMGEGPGGYFKVEEFDLEGCLIEVWDESYGVALTVIGV